MNQYVKLHDDLAELVRTSARVIVPQLIQWLNPRSVVDVGCGNASWLAVFQAHNMTDILGIDGDYIRPESLEIPREKFQTHNLSEPLNPCRQYDLAVCTEVAEHLSESAARRLVQDLTKLAPVVVFSAAIPGQGGVDHINEQWQSYWVSVFAEQGYICRDTLRTKYWSNPQVAYWYAQNLLVFCNASQLQRLPVEWQVEQPTLPLDLVHPTRLHSIARENEYLRNPSIREALGLLGRSLARKIGLKT